MRLTPSNVFYFFADPSLTATHVQMFPYAFYVVTYLLSLTSCSVNFSVNMCIGHSIRDVYESGEI